MKIIQYMYVSQGDKNYVTLVKLKSCSWLKCRDCSSANLRLVLIRLTANALLFKIGLYISCPCQLGLDPLHGFAFRLP